ncbi:hypothetical protein [Streptomyces sp. NPDC057426]|uniref:hypothetical protein n=1 Tax=Streptomyces sp. NPDC057426 TaxID=3346128 RepID=UPI003683661E
MLEEILRAEAEALHEQFDDHDTDDFLRRLAVRIAAEAQKPPRVQHSRIDGPAPAAQGMQPDPITAAQLPAPAQTPDPRTTRPSTSSRPRIRRGLRRRPTPIVTSDPSANPTAVLAHVRWLCDVVLRSNDIDRLHAFSTDYDQAGARTFACLLYSLDRQQSALFWWRFAAGAGDALAAHLLAAHHAAVGRATEARVWRACARMLDFDSHRDIPQPVRSEGGDIAEGFATRVPWDEERQAFLYLPRDLVTR